MALGAAPGGAFSWGGSSTASRRRRRTRPRRGTSQVPHHQKEMQIEAFRLRRLPVADRGPERRLHRPAHRVPRRQKARQLWKGGGRKDPAMAVDKFDPKVATEVVNAELENVLEKNKGHQAALADAQAAVLQARASLSRRANPTTNPDSPGAAQGQPRCPCRTAVRPCTPAPPRRRPRRRCRSPRASARAPVAEPALGAQCLHQPVLHPVRGVRAVPCCCSRSTSRSTAGIRPRAWPRYASSRSRTTSTCCATTSGSTSRSTTRCGWRWCRACRSTR